MTGYLYALYYAGFILHGWDDEQAHELALIEMNRSSK